MPYPSSTAPRRAGLGPETRFNGIPSATRMLQSAPPPPMPQAPQGAPGPIAPSLPGRVDMTSPRARYMAGQRQPRGEPTTPTLLPPGPADQAPPMLAQPRDVGMDMPAPQPRAQAPQPRRGRGPDIASLIQSHFAGMAPKGPPLAPVVNALGRQGIRGDTTMAHLSPPAQGILRAAGGAGDRNPATGLPKFDRGSDSASGENDYDPHETVSDLAGRDYGAGPSAADLDMSKAAQAFSGPTSPGVPNNDFAKGIGQVVGSLAGGALGLPVGGGYIGSQIADLIAGNPAAGRQSPMDNEGARGGRAGPDRISNDPRDGGQGGGDIGQGDAGGADPRDDYRPTQQAAPTAAPTPGDTAVSSPATDGNTAVKSKIGNIVTPDAIRALFRRGSPGAIATSARPPGSGNWGVRVPGANPGIDYAPTEINPRTGLPMHAPDDPVQWAPDQIPTGGMGGGGPTLWPDPLVAPGQHTMADPQYQRAFNDIANPPGSAPQVTSNGREDMPDRSQAPITRSIGSPVASRLQAKPAARGAKPQAKQPANKALLDALDDHSERIATERLNMAQVARNPDTGLPMYAPNSIAGLITPESVRAAASTTADHMARYGQHGDTELAHVNPGEIKLLERLTGNRSRNPVTGARQFFDAAGYLAANPDVAQGYAANPNSLGGSPTDVNAYALEHYNAFGGAENRQGGGSVPATPPSSDVNATPSMPWQAPTGGNPPGPGWGSNVGYSLPNSPSPQQTGGSLNDVTATPDNGSSQVNPTGSTPLPQSVGPLNERPQATSAGMTPGTAQFSDGSADQGSPNPTEPAISAPDTVKRVESAGSTPDTGAPNQQGTYDPNNPPGGFNATNYLAANPDVAAGYASNSPWLRTQQAKYGLDSPEAFALYQYQTFGGPIEHRDVRGLNPYRPTVPLVPPPPPPESPPPPPPPVSQDQIQQWVAQYLQQQGNPNGLQSVTQSPPPPPMTANAAIQAITPNRRSRFDAEGFAPTFIG